MDKETIILILVTALPLILCFYFDFFSLNMKVIDYEKYKNQAFIILIAYLLGGILSYFVFEYFNSYLIFEVSFIIIIIKFIIILLVKNKINKIYDEIYNSEYTPITDLSKIILPISFFLGYINFSITLGCAYNNWSSNIINEMHSFILYVVGLEHIMAIYLIGSIFSFGKLRVLTKYTFIFNRPILYMNSLNMTDSAFTIKGYLIKNNNQFTHIKVEGRKNIEVNTSNIMEMFIDE